MERGARDWVAVLPLCSGGPEEESLFSRQATDAVLRSRGVGARVARGWSVLASSVAKERNVALTVREGWVEDGDAEEAAAFLGLHHTTAQKVLITEGLEGNKERWSRMC